MEELAGRISESGHNGDAYMNLPIKIKKVKENKQQLSLMPNAMKVLEKGISKR